MPRKCGLCKKEGHNRNNCENAHYKGEYNYKGERHGKGTYEYKLSKYKKTSLENGKYEGDWVNGKREGKGKMTIHNYHGIHTWLPKGGGNTYDGEWKNDKRHGKGIMKCSNGNILKDGIWKNDKFEGKIEFKDGAILMGKFNHYGVICDGTPGEIKSGNMTITGVFHQMNNYHTHKRHNYFLIRCKFAYKKQNYTVIGSFRANPGSSTRAIGYFPDKLEINININRPCAKSQITHKSGNSCNFPIFRWSSKNNFTYTGNNKLIKQWLGEEIYTGEYNTKKQKHGKGVTIYANDDKYDGDWVNDKREGKGVMTYSNGNKYDGEWAKGHKVKGIMTFITVNQYDFAAPIKYDGEWKNGVRGIGGRVVDDDLLEGKGIMIYKNGDKYDGDWVNGKREGKGIMTYSNGGKYDGEWKNDKRMGEGILIYKNGDKYEGKWTHGYPHGVGVKTFKNGNEYEGKWVSGCLNPSSDIIIRYANGDKYKGKYKSIKDIDANLIQETICNLNGVMTYVTGERFVGKFVSNKKEGKGSFFNKEGIEYRGQWKNDKKEGLFFLFKGKNYCNVFEFKDDKLVKKYKPFKDKSIEKL